MMLSLKMKLTRIFLLFLLPLATYAQSGSPVLQAGVVSVSGEVIIPASIKKDSIWIMLTISHPFTSDIKMYKTLLDANGRFTLKVNTQTDISICAVRTNINLPVSALAILKNGRENKISLTYNKAGVINKISSSDHPLKNGGENTPSLTYNDDRIINKKSAGNDPGFTETDMLQALGKIGEAIDYIADGPREPHYNKTFTGFTDHAHKVLQERQDLLVKPSALSPKMKEVVFKEFSLFMYEGHVLDYHAEMVRIFKNMNRRLPDSSEIMKPDRSYFSFLKKLDLNNPLYLYTYNYPSFTRSLLLNSTLNIPHIEDTPIDEWTKDVKETFGDMFGFKQGMFYDMLISNAYAMQMEVELKPLTVKQIENIKNYYKGSDLEKILLQKNREIAPHAQTKTALVINNTPNVSPEKLISTIISKYKGKTVIVDFWATWCSPCLEAMKTSRDLKKQFAGKDVVYVYITNPTSPKKLWEQYIEGIGGEQYYLTAAQWSYLFDSFEFEGVPSYLIYDKKGELKEHFTGYPGNEEMGKMVETAL